MITTSVGRGDVGPFRHDGTNVRRTAEALVAIGDGADAEHAHGTCSPWVEGELRHDVGGCSRRRSIIIVIALVIVIAARESACGDARAGGGIGNGGARLDRGAGLRGLLNRGPSPCCEASVRRWRACAEPDARRRSCSREDQTAHRARALPARSAAAWAGECAQRWPIRIPAVGCTGLRALTAVVKTQKAAGAVRHRPLYLSRAPIRPVRPSRECPSASPCRRGCR